MTNITANLSAIHRDERERRRKRARARDVAVHAARIYTAAVTTPELELGAGVDFAAVARTCFEAAEAFAAVADERGEP